MTETPPDDSSRLDELEMRIAHQDRTLADLNDVITAQWRRIDELERRMADLKEELRNITPPRSAPEPPPPHY